MTITADGRLSGMRVRFWGVRGSTPTPHRSHLRYGGNTSCVEVRAGDGPVLVLDGGTGIRMLGDELRREFGERAIDLHVLFSHFHMDHIQGVPFFEPLHHPQHRCVFYGANPPGVRSALNGLMTAPYSPIGLSDLSCTCAYVDIGDAPFTIGDATILTLPLNHPQGCAGYRIAQRGGVLAYCTDVEHGPEWSDRNLRALAKEADLLIIDAQYTPDELQQHAGWGHGSWRQAVDAGAEAGARRIALYHHDPNHDDRTIDSMLADARGLHPNVVAIAASEGLEICLSGSLRDQ